MIWNRKPAPSKVVDPEYAKRVTVNDIDAAIERADARLDVMQGRWILALAVANSAGLTALGSKTFDIVGGAGAAAGREAALALALPSLWLFAVGIAAAGITHIGAHMEGIGISRQLRKNRALLVAKPETTFAEMGPHTYKTWDWIKLWFWEGVSAISFLAGLTYPLAVLSIRYVRDGAIVLP